MSIHQIYSWRFYSDQYPDLRLEGYSRNYSFRTFSYQHDINAKTREEPRLATSRCQTDRRSRRYGIQITWLKPGRFGQCVWGNFLLMHVQIYTYYMFICLTVDSSSTSDGHKQYDIGKSMINKILQCCPKTAS